jgi:hypothetical protein
VYDIYDAVFLNQFYEIYYVEGQKIVLRSISTITYIRSKNIYKYIIIIGL